MTGMTYEEKCSIGFQYIMDCLNPSSPYGMERIRRLAPYGKDRQGDLEASWDQIRRMREIWTESQAEIGRLRRVFMQMKDIRRTLKKAAEMCLNDLELFEIKNFLIFAEEAQAIWEGIAAAAGVRQMRYRPLGEPLDLLDPEGRRIPTFSIYDSYSEKLAEIRRKKRQLEKEMKGAEDEGERSALQERRRLLVVEEEEEEQRVRQALTDGLQPGLEAIRYDTEVTGEIDLLLEKVAASLLAPSVEPVLSDDPLEFEEMTNPWVASVLKEKGLEFTPLSISLTEGAGVITGANMGGKSVALNTITLNVYLSLCGFYPYASMARLPLFDGIQILSGERQSVDQGLSSFGAQIVQLQRIVGEIEEGFCFVVLDEFSRGTNPHEGAALVRAVTRYLNEKHVIALLVTHFDHVAEYGKRHYQVAGLKDMDVEKVRREIAASGRENGVAAIAACMNYGLYRVDGLTDCPRDAFRICSLLGLDQGIMDYLDEE